MKFNEAIIQVINDKINNQVCFTIWDITNAVRNLGVWAKHSNVKSVFEDLWVQRFTNTSVSLSSYECSIEDIGSIISPRIYHPIGDRNVLQDYVDAAKSNKHQSPQQTIVTSQPTVDNSSNTVYDGVKGVDKKNRFRFKKNHLDALGFLPGDRVAVYFDSNSFGLCDVNNIPQGVKSVEYIVDKYQNVRVALNSHGFAPNKTYRVKINLDDNKVEVI